MVGAGANCCGRGRAGGGTRMREGDERDARRLRVPYMVCEFGACISVKMVLSVPYDNKLYNSVVSG